MKNTQYQTLRYEISDRVAQVILDRPPANLIDRASTLELHAALTAADADPEVGVVLLSGTGKGLSGGVDLNYLEGFGREQMREFLQLFYVETLRITRGMSKPIIALVHGYAREGACTLAFACDMVIAAEDATFGYPGVPNLAAPPGMHVWFLQKLIGRMRAAELILTGEPIAADQAASLGLITRCVPAASLREEGMVLAQKIAGLSPLALKRSRDLMYKMEDMSFTEVPQAALEALSAAFDSEDSHEARRAFLEKRKPVWKGR
jgi:enoyl-CoA hydratase/carnithine racemase